LAKVNYYDFIYNGNYLVYPNNKKPQLLILVSDYSSFSKVVRALKFNTYKFKLFKSFSFIAWLICKFIYINKLGNIKNADDIALPQAILLPFAGDEKLTKICLDVNSKLFVEKLGWGLKKSLIETEYKLLNTYSEFTPKVYDLNEYDSHSSYSMEFIDFTSDSLYKDDFSQLIQLMRARLKSSTKKLRITDFQAYQFIKEQILNHTAIHNSVIKDLVGRCFQVLDADLKLYEQYICHGDFTESNLVFDGSKLQVIDWEHSFSSLPFFEDRYFTIVKNFNSGNVSKISDTIDCLSVMYFIYFILKVNNSSLLTNGFINNFDISSL